MLEIIDSGNLSHVTSRGAYMPSVTQLSDNSLIACQHVGEALGSPDNHIEVLRSADSAKTWMNQGSIHEGGPPQAGWMYRGPDIQQAPDGRLVMTATRFEVGDGALFDPDSEALQRPEMGEFWSSDGGPTSVGSGTGAVAHQDAGLAVSGVSPFVPV